MVIFLRLLNDVTLTLEVEPDTLIDEVRDVVKKRMLMRFPGAKEVDGNLLRLIVGGKQLEDGYTLSAYGVLAESTIQVAPMLRGS